MARRPDSTKHDRNRATVYGLICGAGLALNGTVFVHDSLLLAVLGIVIPIGVMGAAEINRRRGLAWHPKTWLSTFVIAYLITDMIFLAVFWNTIGAGGGAQ